MSRLETRLAKLEQGTAGVVLMSVPDGLSAPERQAFVQEHLRAQGLRAERIALCVGERERKL